PTHTRCTPPPPAPAPNAPGTQARGGAPPAIRRAPATPASAIDDPTERSMPPDTITTVMPIAMIVMTAVCRATPARLPAERNTGLTAAMTTHSATRLANGRNLFTQSDIGASLRRSSPQRHRDTA